MSKTGWQKAVDEAVRREGSLRAVARRLGITHQAIRAWPPRGPKAEHVPALEEMSGFPRWMIRPDIYERTPSKKRTVEQSAAA